MSHDTFSVTGGGQRLERLRERWDATVAVVPVRLGVPLVAAAAITVVVVIAAGVFLFAGGPRTAERAEPTPAPTAASSPTAGAPTRACSDAIRSARQGSVADQAAAVLRSLDACRGLDEWSTAAAVAGGSASRAAARSEALELCGNSSIQVQRTLTCSDAIGPELVATRDSSSGGAAGPSTDGVLVGRQRGVSADGNRLLMRWSLTDESGAATGPVPFTYRIIGPLPAPVEGVAPAGAAGPVEIPGWEPGMTIRVELTSTTEPSTVYSAPLTHDGF